MVAAASDKAVGTRKSKQQRCLSTVAAAQRAGDFAKTDATRNELRAQGIDADIVTACRTRYDAEMKAKLEEFAAAKRAGDFAKVDAIRKELRARGIDADMVVAARKQSLRSLLQPSVQETLLKLMRFVRSYTHKELMRFVQETLLKLR